MKPTTLLLTVAVALVCLLVSALAPNASFAQGFTVVGPETTAAGNERYEFFLDATGAEGTFDTFELILESNGLFQQVDGPSGSGLQPIGDSGFSTLLSSPGSMGGQELYGFGLGAATDTPSLLSGTFASLGSNAASAKGNYLIAQIVLPSFGEVSLRADFYDDGYQVERLRGVLGPEPDSTVIESLGPVLPVVPPPPPVLPPAPVELPPAPEVIPPDTSGGQAEPIGGPAALPDPPDANSGQVDPVEDPPTEPVLPSESQSPVATPAIESDPPGEVSGEIDPEDLDPETVSLPWESSVIDPFWLCDCAWNAKIINVSVYQIDFPEILWTTTSIPTYPVPVALEGGIVAIDEAVLLSNSSFAGQFINDGNFGGQVEIELSVPEPSTLALLGLCGLAIVSRRRRG